MTITFGTVHHLKFPEMWEMHATVQFRISCPVAGSCEHGNGPSGSKIHREFLEQLGNSWSLKKGSALGNWLVTIAETGSVSLVRRKGRNALTQLGLLQEAGLDPWLAQKEF
jgi:hypothetical protein